MKYSKDYVPKKIFEEFKWQWACLMCTESLNNPVILLGVLAKMRKWEGKKKYSSAEFSEEIQALENDIDDVIPVNLSGRGGERNIIRNSGQYWKGVGLIDDNSRGLIILTPFGRRVADHEISQAEFAAATIRTLTLPNIHVYRKEIVVKWKENNLFIHPLLLILSILEQLKNNDSRDAYITGNELIKIIIPLSGVNADIDDYVNFIRWSRNGEISLEKWPDCCPSANDKRMAREFLLFLKNYGYLNILISTGSSRFESKFSLNKVLSDEVEEIINLPDADNLDTIENIRKNDIVTNIERKRVLAYRIARPNQSKFRKNILGAYSGQCVFTNVAMTEVLEAAHIKPVEYNGNDSITNGMCMRVDVHTLFDTGNLRIDLDGKVFLSKRARNDYGSVIPQQIVIPEFVDKGLLLWRWNYYNGI